MERLGQLNDGRMLVAMVPAEAARIGELIRGLAESYAPVVVENGEVDKLTRDLLKPFLNLREVKVRKLRKVKDPLAPAPEKGDSKRDKICEQCKLPYRDTSRTNVTKRCDKCKELDKE